MPIVRVEIRPEKVKLNHMEYSILEAAKTVSLSGADHLLMRLFVEEEIAKWKKQDRYRNSGTFLEYRSKWEMALMNADKKVLAILKTVL